MKTRLLTFPRSPFRMRGFRSRTVVLIAGLTISACTAARLDAAVFDDFEDPARSATLWTNWFFSYGTGIHTVANGDVKLELTQPAGEWGFCNTMSHRAWTLQEGRTLEFRVDLVSSSCDGALAWFGFWLNDGNRGYIILVDEDTVVLHKSSIPRQLFFLTNGTSIKVSNVKLVLSMTGTNSAVLLKFKILDNDNAGAVLFERECWDTAAADPMAPGYPDNPPESYLGQSGHFLLSLFADQEIIDPDVPGRPLPKVEVAYDNAEVLEYDLPSLEIAKSVLLSWSENTEEDQVVVMADSVMSTNWTPCPQPAFIGSGGLSVAVPITASPQYFKLVPGRQFADCFSDCSGPFTNRSPWVPLFQDPGEEWVVTNGVLRFRSDPPTFGLALCPLGANVEANLRDSYMSVDILDWVASGTNMSMFSLNARIRMTSDISATTYMGGLSHNRDGIPGKVRPWIWDGFDYVRGTDFYLQDHPLPYRLQFSVVGTRLSFQVLSLSTGALIREVVVPNDSTFTSGFGGIYVRTGQSNPGDSFTVTVDNFFMSGTKP